MLEILESLAVKNGIAPLPLKNNFTAPAKCSGNHQHHPELCLLFFSVKSTKMVQSLVFFSIPKKMKTSQPTTELLGRLCIVSGIFRDPQ